MWRAKQLGGSELKDYSRYLDWNATTYVIADLIDAVNQNSAYLIGINSDGNKMPDVPPYPRPGHETTKPKSSLDDFVGGQLIQLFPGAKH